MDFTTAQTELFARGYDYLNDGGTQLARAKRWINQSYLTLCAKYSWPFLYADSTGNSPLTIADLRAVLSVSDTTNQQHLSRIDRRAVMEMDPNLTAGTPAYYYLDSSTQLKVWPVQVVSLSVRYLKTPAQLVNAGDTMLVPDEWSDVVIDGAVLRAKKDDDEYDQLAQMYQQTVADMAAAILPQGFDNADYMSAEPKDY